MIKIIISFIIIILYGCNISINNSKIRKINNNSEASSYSAVYLTANYSISKGDVITASKILNEEINDPNLLKLKFISNLVSGNFKYADTMSEFLNPEFKTKPIFYLPKLAISIKKNDVTKTIKVLNELDNFQNFGQLKPLLNFWTSNRDDKNEFKVNYNLAKNSIYKFFILENFYNINDLNSIADHHYKNKDLTNLELFFLAGYYYRQKNMKKFNLIIEDRLSNQFDKGFILKNFSSLDNFFHKTPDLRKIIAFKIYNTVIEKKISAEISSSYLKVLLEMIVFICPNMDIAKLGIAEIYHNEKSNEIALKKLNLISKKSYFYLASNLKKFSILKEKNNSEYKKLLDFTKNIWPDNKFILIEEASFHKSKKNYQQTINIYDTIISIHGKTDRILFLYAASLDKTDQWNKAKEILLNLIEKNPENTYALNYLSYSLALRNEELNFSLRLIKKALSIEPNNGYFLDTIGWVEYKRNNFERSVFYLEKSVVLLPKSSEVIDHLGDCYLKLNRTTEAVYQWKKAIKLEKDINIVNKIKKKIKKYE